MRRLRGPLDRAPAGLIRHPPAANATKFITAVELLLSTYIDTYVHIIDEPASAG